MSLLACVTDETTLHECNPLPSSQLISKLNKLSLRMSDFTSNQFNSESPNPLQHIFSPSSRVIQVAISSTHVAFLLDSNEICRVKYLISSLRSPHSSSFPDKDSGFSDLDDRHIYSSNESNISTNSNNATKLKPKSSLAFTSEQLEKSRFDVNMFDSSTILRGRGMQSLRSSSRSLNLRSLGRYPSPNSRRNFLINPRRTIRTANDVPEDLITQAQAVLQGKNRSLIFRELQRTGLDVNQAVNNLLSREDDCEDDESTPIVLGSDELFYLFESGGTSVPMGLELSPQDRDASSLGSFVQPINRLRDFRGSEYTSGRESRLGFSSPSTHDTHLDRLSDIIFTYSSIHGVQPTPQGITSTCNTDEYPATSKVIEHDVHMCQSSWVRENTDINEFSLPSNNCFSPRIQFIPGPFWWVNGNPDYSFSFLPPPQCIKFSSITSTDTDLVAITMSGHLAYWPWDKPNGIYSPKQHTFPFSPSIDIKSTDHIKLISSSRYRIALLTEGNSIASMSDRTLRSTLFSFGSSIDTAVHQLHIYPNQTVASLTCSDQFSACITSDGQIFWWGYLPYIDRKRAIMRIKNKFRTNLRKNNPRTGCALNQEIIREGSTVLIRHSPFYSIGTRALYFQRNALVGILQENIYSLNEKCRFKLLVQQSCLQDAESLFEESFNKEKVLTYQGPVNEHSYSVTPFTQSWHCKDVIFLDEPRFHSSPGEVIKIEGNLAVVSFSDKTSDSSRQQTVDLSSCRLVKKEDLVLQRSCQFHKTPVCSTTIPKRLTISPDCKPLTITATNKGLYLLYTQNHIPKLGIISLEASKVENIHFFPYTMSSFFIPNRPLILTIGPGQSFFVQDTIGNFLPLIKSQSNTFREIPFIPLPPVTAFSFYNNLKNKISMMFFSCNKNILTPFIISSSPESLISEFQNASKNSKMFQDAKLELTNGNFNLFHTAIRASLLNTSFPTDNDFMLKTLTDKHTINTNCPIKSEDLSLCLQQDCGIYSSISILQNNFSEDKTKKSSIFSDIEKIESEQKPSEDRFVSKNLPLGITKCIEILIDLLEFDLPRLFGEKNSNGHTPFMLAVHERTYDAALLIFAAIMQISTNLKPGNSKDEVIFSMIYPPGSAPDDNPLFMLCANDVCSVTWTGESHETLIDIYECRTCGLVGDLCCCSECYRVCHKGHDCQKKQHPMKAFCDCRKLCHCRAMTPGNQFLRFQLLEELIHLKKLQSLMNSHNEYILTFLLFTHSRQVREQIRKDTSYNIPNNDVISAPQEQFMFSKCALEVCLTDWRSIEAVFTASGTVHSSQIVKNFHYLQGINLSTNESNAYIHTQHGTTHIEKIVYTLLLHNSSEFVAQLLSTLTQAYKRQEVNYSIVISRFLRTVIRIFLISSYDQWAPQTTQTRKHNQNIQHLSQVIFRSMNKLTMVQLWRIAQSIVIPLQLGIVKPCDPISTELRKRNIVDDLFRSPNVQFPSNSNVTIDSDCKSSCSESSQDSDCIVNEYESIATPENTSVTTRATTGSSHIIPYISGDSTSDSEEIPPEEGLDSALELIEVPNDFPLMNAVSSLSPPNPSIDGQSIGPAKPNDKFQVELISPLSYNPIILDSIEEGILIPNEINLNTDVPTITTNQESHYSSLNSDIYDTQWRISSEYSALSWQPAFELLSHRSSIPTSLNKRKNNYVVYPHESSYPSYSHQEQILARSFNFLIEKLIDVLKHLSCFSTFSIPWEPSDITCCFTEIWYEMEPILTWLIHVMDPLESQLRFGSSLVSPYAAFLSGKLLNEGLNSSFPRVSPAQEVNLPYLRSNTRPSYEPISTSNSTKPTLRIDSLEYLLSLTRSSFYEHREFLPPINLTSMEHIAYVLDAVLYFLYNQPNEVTLSDLIKQSQTKHSNLSREHSIKCLNSNSRIVSVLSNDYLALYNPIQTLPIASKVGYGEIEECLTDNIDSFFQRSSCMSFFGCPKPNYLAPIETLPCAEMPHLLQPQTRREILFGAPQDPTIPDPEEGSPFHFMNSLTCLLSLPLIKCFSQLDRLTSFRDLFKSIKVLSEFEIDQGILNFKRAADVLMGRWRLSIELFCKLLYEKDRCDNIHMLQLLQDFPSKENKFREEMEKLTSALIKDQRDLLIDVSRDRNSLIVETFQQLSSYFECHKELVIPLCVKQVKVTFKNEQGEGSGVARSFYTSFADAILSDEDLPSLEDILLVCDTPNFHKKELNDISIEESCDDSRLLPLNLTAAPFHPHHPSVVFIEKMQQGTHIYHQVSQLIGSLHSRKLTGMLLELPSTLIYSLCNNPSLLSRYVRNAYEKISDHLAYSHLPPSYHDLNPSLDLNEILSNSSENALTVKTDTATLAKRYKPSEFSDLTPLFFEPGKSGFYSPRSGKYTAQRSLAYLCVGRIIGLCLLTSEIFPAPFTRHVFKYLMGKDNTICWQDYAFMDPVGFEALRKILLLAQEGNSNSFLSLDLTFQISLTNYESIELVDLVNNGSAVPVTIDNVRYYIKLYTEYRMKHVVREALLDIHLGLSDVIPIKHFINISPEDFRLMLNGCFSFNLDSLKKIVIVNNESKEDNKSVSKLIKWFWCLVKGFSEKEKQDLLYFWTSSPKMPSNIHSYQPEPSIHVRPPEEDYLPTANTCIARLYLPLYSARSHLKSKLLLAIKTKTFGFV